MVRFHRGELSRFERRSLILPGDLHMHELAGHGLAKRASICSNRVKLSPLYSFSGSRWP